MTRRDSLLILSSLLINGVSRLEGKEGNLTVDLNQFRNIVIKFKDKEYIVTGENIWTALTK